MTPLPRLQIYLWPRVTFTFDLLTQKLIIHALDPWATWANWHQNRLTLLKNIVFRSLATDERLKEWTDTDRLRTFSCLCQPVWPAWHRHIVYNMQNNSTKKGLISITIPDVYTVKKKSTFNWTRKPTRPNRVVRPPNLPSALCDLDLWPPDPHSW